MSEQKVIGWILATKPERCEGYNYHFYPETGAANTPIKYSDPLFPCDEMGAAQRVQKELQYLLEGKTKMYGDRIVHGYIMAIVTPALTRILEQKD